MSNLKQLYHSTACHRRDAVLYGVIKDVSWLCRKTARGDGGGVARRAANKTALLPSTPNASAFSSLPLLLGAPHPLSCYFHTSHATYLCGAIARYSGRRKTPLPRVCCPHAMAGGAFASCASPTCSGGGGRPLLPLHLAAICAPTYINDGGVKIAAGA